MSYLPLKIAGDLFYGNFSLCISFDIENVVMTYSEKSRDSVTDIYKQNVTYGKRHPISDTEKTTFSYDISTMDDYCGQYFFYYFI